MTAPRNPRDFLLSVGQLKEALAEFSDDLVVVMSADSEGNKYSPFSGISHQYRYRPDSTWSGEILDPGLTEDDGQPYYEQATLDEAIPCLVLWPVN